MNQLNQKKKNMNGILYSLGRWGKTHFLETNVNRIIQIFFTLSCHLLAKGGVASVGQKQDCWPAPGLNVGKDAFV